MTTVTRFTPAESGWQLVQTVSRARMTRGGVPVETVVDEVLSRLTLRLRLAADGAFVKVVNADEGLKALRAGGAGGAAGRGAGGLLRAGGGGGAGPPRVGGRSTAGCSSATSR